MMKIDIEEKFWIFPFLGGFSILIACITPAAWKYEIKDGILVFFKGIWIFGIQLIYRDGMGFQIYYQSKYNIYTLSVMIIATIIFISSVLLIIQGNNVRINKRDVEDIKGTCLFLSIFIIILIILWMILTEIDFFLFSLGTSFFWSQLFPGFGIIGMFLGSIIIGIGLLYRNVDVKRLHKKIYQKEKSEEEKLE